MLDILPIVSENLISQRSSYGSNRSIFIMITDNEKGLMIEHFMAQVKTQDLLNIAFMKPLEVALRTHKNDKNVPTDSLPKGLMQAVKSSINDNKYKLTPFQPIQPKHKSLQDLKAKQLDNYISLLKKSEQKDETEAERKSQRASMIEQISVQQKEEKHNGLELGICISMRNEDKKKLKSTLVGVADNIDELVRSGVSPDDIFVVVVIDGVTNVDSSIYEYFDQFERESQIYLQQDDKLTLRKKYEHQLYHSQVETDQPLNYSKFLFKKDEFKQRIDSKFINIRKKYDEILRIKKSIQNIKKQHNKDNDNLKMIVNRLADRQKTIMKKINKGKQDKSIVINQQSIMKELETSEQECNQYVNTRQQLAYVSVYRMPTISMSQDCRIKQMYSTEKQVVQMESQLDSQRLMNHQIDRTSIRQSLKLSTGVVGTALRYVNLFFCIKYKQSGKLNSHNWFLNGFCQQLNPRYTVLLDVGVRPYPDAIFKMYRHMKLDDSVGAVCGYLRLVEQILDDEERVRDEDVDCMTSLMFNLFDIQRAQQIETHYNHFLDKSFQALFKFIHVVPGSFSGYNMKALHPPQKKNDLLKSYFRTIDQKMTTNKIVASQFTVGSIVSRIFLPKTIWKRFTNIDADSEQQILYDQNTYLSQDRVLCLGIHKNGKDITFLPNVYAQVQPIKQINSLMEQKKKELNSSMFSFEKVQEQFDHVTQKRQKFLVKFQFLYLSFTKFMQFFAPALLIFALQFACQIVQLDFLSTIFGSESDSGLGNVIYRTFQNIIIFIYALCLLAIFFFSIHLNAKDKKYVYYAHLASTVLGVFTVIAGLVFIVQMFLSLLAVGDSYIQKNYVTALALFMPTSQAVSVATMLRAFIFTTIFMIYAPAVTYSFAFGKFGVLWQVLVGSPAYIYYLPTYCCIMPIYSKCRLDDVASKGFLTKNEKIKQSWKIVKMIDVAKYLIWNMIAGVILIYLQSILLVKFFVTLILLFLFTVLSVIKWIPGLVYIIQYKMNKKENPLQPSHEQKVNNIAKMKLKIIETVKFFEEDFKFNIKSSFADAAIQNQTKELEKQHKKQTISKVQQQPQQQTNLSAKVQNIRQSYVPKAGFYPFPVGVAKKQAKPVAQQADSVPLELVLLRNKFGQTAKNQQLKAQQQKLKKYQNFRATIKPLGF